MKILLVGEFSGVHNNLKKGLNALGHDVTLAADGDSYRGFDSDFKLKPYSITSKMNRIVRWFYHLRNILYFIKNYKTFFGNDIVQFISPFAIQSTYFLISYLIFWLNKKTIYYVCGADPAYLKSEEHFKYFPYDDKKNMEYPKYNGYSLKYYKRFIKRIDQIIPSMYSYKVGYCNSTKLTDPIPLPGIGKYVGKNEVSDKKINILHGITRFNFKGSKYILEALDELEKRFPQTVNVIVVEKLPFEEYIKLYQNAHIIIDQCKSYDYGMNAIYAMEHGKIVLSGAEDVAMEYLGFEGYQIINIKPNMNQIVAELEKIIRKNSDDISKMENESISFVKKYHNPIKIARKFETIYSTDTSFYVANDCIDLRKIPL